MPVQTGDWVKCKSMAGSPITGFVKKMAKDGSWCDVNWGPYTKRMKTEVLFAVHTIGCDDIWITDCTREKEMEGEHGAT